MKKISRILCTALVLCLLLTVAPFGAFAAPADSVSFKDIDNWASEYGAPHWAEAYISFWSNKISADGDGYVITGYANGDGSYDFRPNGPVTRGAVAAILDRIFGFEATGKVHDFSDVPVRNVFYVPIMDCADHEVIRGYADNTFRPSNPITRQAAIAMIARCTMTEQDYAEFSDSAANKTIITAKFPVDVDQINAKFYPEFAFLIKYAGLEGYGDGTVRPGSNITRAAFLRLLYTVSHGGNDPVVQGKSYQLDITIRDNKGNSVTDMAEFLTADSNIMLTVLSLCIADRDKLAAVFPSDAMRDIFDEGIAIYSSCNPDGWTSSEKAQWNAFVAKYFRAVGGSVVLMDACSDFNSTIDAFATDAAYSISIADTDADRVDYVYTVTIRVSEMIIL